MERAWTARGAATSTRGWRLIVLTMLLTLFGLAGDGARAQEREPERVVDLPGGGSMGSNAGAKTAVKPAAGVSSAIGSPQLPDLSNRQNLSSALQLVILLTVLSL